jgi:hypothetical protein
MDAMKASESTRTMKGSTLSPGESSVYNFSIVLDDPPAPAARDELGRETCDVPARRRIWAPGGLATALVVEREDTERVGASESDMSVVWRKLCTWNWVACV